MKIIRGRLNPADVGNPSFRYDATCDCIQQTPDNGATWVDVPQADPRHSVGFLKPPVAGSNKECDAAANMVKWIKDFIDYETSLMVAGATITTLVNSILTPMDLLFPAADFLSLIIDIADTVFGIGAAGLTAAFTSTEYDLLNCIFFCDIGGDGRVSADQLANIEGDISAQLNTTAALVINAILFLQGEIGLSNAGSIGGQTGDCTACACGWEACIVGADLASVFSIVGANGTFVLGGVATATVFAGGDPTRPRNQAYITATFDSCSVNRIQTFFTAPDGFDNTCGSDFATSSYYHDNFDTLIAFGSGTPGDPFVFSGSLTLSDLQLNIGVACCDGCGTPPNTGTITAVHIRGTGTPPSQFTPYLC